MKAFHKILFAVAVMIGFVGAAFAQTYPYTNPTYIPNLRVPQAVIASGVANTTVLLNNIGTAAVDIDGTCTSLNGRLEASNDGVDWFTLNLYPYNATTAASAVTSVGAVGLWVGNVSGYNMMRLNNSAVSGTACTVTLSGSSAAFSLPR